MMRVGTSKVARTARSPARRGREAPPAPHMWLAMALILVYCVGIYFAQPMLPIMIIDLFLLNRGLTSSLQAWPQPLSGRVVTTGLAVRRELVTA
jgi:hypothetical protein